MLCHVPLFINVKYRQYKGWVILWAIAHEPLPLSVYW